jgi:hypothetical protein
MSATPVLRTSNLLLKFLLELAAFAAFAYWGASVADGALSVVLAVAVPAVAIALWAAFAAPRSSRRLGTPARVPFELSVFGLAVVALLAAGAGVAALVLATLVAANTALLARFRQWEA